MGMRKGQDSGLCVWGVRKEEEVWNMACSLSCCSVRSGAQDSASDALQEGILAGRLVGSTYTMVDMVVFVCLWEVMSAGDGITRPAGRTDAGIGGASGEPLQHCKRPVLSKLMPSCGLSLAFSSQEPKYPGGIAE